MNYYHNPIKKSGDFADPFVMQYDGVYYLYCTNPDLLIMILLLLDCY